MLKLIQNELMKIFKRPGTYVMIVLIIIITSVAGAFLKYQDQGTTAPGHENWKQELQAENDNLKKELKEIGDKVPEGQISYMKKQIAINEYRIEHNLSPNEEYSMWNFVAHTSEVIQFAGLFTIIIAAGIVASEFNWGTIKLLLIRPISRGKILVAKYITVILFALLMLFILFVYSTALGAILFGPPESTVPYLNYYDGKVTEQPMIVHLVIFYVMKSINMIMLATMAFMISAVFRNSSLAIGLSLFLMLMGGQITSLLAMKFDWAKYILFANTDLMQYFEGVPLVEGMTLTFSVIMLVLYFVLFQFLAHYVFKKRDVAA